MGPFSLSCSQLSDLFFIIGDEITTGGSGGVDVGDVVGGLL